LVCVAAPLYLRSKSRLTVKSLVISFGAIAVMLVAFAGSLYPVPEFPYSWLPYIFFVLIASGIAFSFVCRNRADRMDTSPQRTAIEPDYV
jgi:hypothetical protein